MEHHAAWPSENPRPPSPVLEGGFRGAGLRNKLRAAGVHLGLSAVVAVLVVLMAAGGWYPPPLHALVGVGTILGLMLLVDVLLGPLVTWVIYDRRKRRLWLDLAVIGVVQLSALLYGVYTVERGRPVFMVLARDRFEVVAPSELRPQDVAAAAGNAAARASWWSPTWVVARQPETPAEQVAIALEAAAVGRDVQHHPRLYLSYAEHADQALTRALPIARLRELNPNAQALLERRVRATGRAEAALRYLPVRGPAQDGAVLLDASTGRVLDIVLLRPW